MKKKEHKVSGFTLTEIMTVVLVMGILLALAVPNFIKYRATSQARACQVNLRSILAAVEEARLERDKTTLDAIKADGKANHLVGKYMRSAPVCQSGGEYAIEYDEDTDSYAITCSSGKEDHEITQP